jgi:hypothetical protein
METPEKTSGPAERRSRTRKRSDRAHTNTVEEPRSRTRSSKLSTENAISEGRRRDPAPSQKPERGGQARLPLEARERDAPPASSTAQGVPHEVERRFVRVGREFYFPDGARAFSDRGRRLTTPSENTEVIRSLIEIARARGWQRLVVSGTERFRRDAWLAAQAAGIDARGYRPSEFEQARAVRARARAQRDESAPGAQPAEGPDSRTTPRLRDERTREDRAKPRGWLKGRLLEHGPANYRNDPAEAPSYFVKLETERGERTVWGVDLERALKQSLSRPQVGDEIALRAVRREPVTVRAPERNERGEVVGTRAVDRQRNRWIVEQQQFLKSRAAAAAVFGNTRIEAKEGARQHPELLGSYLHLQSAKALAAERFRDREDQAVFVERVRRALTQSIARGEPLAPLRLREPPARPASTAQRRPVERDAALVR